MMENSSPYTQCVDWLFAQAQDAGPVPLPTPIVGASAPARAVTLPAEWPSQPPRLERPSDLQTAYAWLQAERGRLEEYTRCQFGLLQEQHHQLLGRYYQNESQLALREQEVNREVQFLTAQAEALRERARGLAEWDEALHRQMDSLAQMQAAPRDAAALEALREETGHRRLSAAAAQAKFDAAEARLLEHKQAWEQKKAEVMARQLEMERRYKDLEKAEEAVGRRLAELDELEERLRQTCKEAAPDPARRQEMERRLRELEQSEGAMERRLAELEELEERLLRLSSADRFEKQITKTRNDENTKKAESSVS
jgi:DNA repair ATPase RecN